MSKLGAPTPASALTAVIEAIGSADFSAAAAAAVGRLIAFDLATVTLHRTGAPSRLLFDNFGDAGCRQGLDNYVRVTSAINPMLAGAFPRAARARDFALEAWDMPDALRPYIDAAPDEELGFRTRGWPAGLEEVGLYFDAWDGVVELSLYRERGRAALSSDRFDHLCELSGPIAAAFERQGALRPPDRDWDGLLSPRETQVADLLLRGCSTEAIELRLGLSRHTVKDYRKRLYRKLGVSCLAELFSLRHRPLPL